MSDGALILIIEDNPRNLKLARDILNHKGYETLEAENAEDGLALARARHPDLVLMDVQLPGMDGVQALGRLRADPETRDIPVIAAHRVRHERRSGAVPRGRIRPLPREAARHPRVPAAGRRGARSRGGERVNMPEQATILVVDDLPQNVRLLEAILAPRGYRVAAANSGREALEHAGRGAGRPRAAGHPDARDGRVRGVPGAARRAVHELPARRDDHRERRAGEGCRDRGRRRRLHPEAVRPGRAARARALAAADQAIPRHDRVAGRRARRLESRARAACPATRSTRSSAWAGSGASCRRSSRSSSCRRATSRSCRATGARSPSCSAISAASRASPRRSSPRTSWPCWASTTRRSVTSSTASTARSSGSRATG